MAGPSNASGSGFGMSTSADVNTNTRGGVHRTTEDDDDEDEESPMAPMYIPSLCSTPQPAHVLANAQPRIVPIIRPPTPPQRPTIPLPARFIGAVQGAAAEEVAHEIRARRRSRPRRVQGARGANEGVGPEGPPLPVLTLGPSREGQDTVGEEVEAEMRRREGIERDDPNDEDSWFRVTDENKDQFFRECHGRKLNVIQPTYQLPADADENKVCAPQISTKGKKLTRRKNDRDTNTSIRRYTWSWETGTTLVQSTPS